MCDDHLKSRGEIHLPGPRNTGRSRWPASTAAFTLGLLLFMGTAMAQEEKGRDEGKSAAPPRQGMPVEAAAVRTMPVAREITAEIAGRIVEVSFEEGQKTARGQVLVRLDRSVLEAQRDRAEASLTLSRANRDRSEVLLREEAISQREWDEASAQWRLDEANLRLAQAPAGENGPSCSLRRGPRPQVRQFR
ncbi:MAG: biotin/lipoyl-binding protein [bacterium]|nr:biotin/lipoyl-binding protein [bacterium]